MKTDVRNPVSNPWITALRKLDSANFDAALQRFENDQISNDPAHRLWRAELLMYLDRHDEALATIADLDTSGELANRRDLIAAELRLWNGEHESSASEAATIAERVRVDDPVAYARALALGARCLIRRGAFVDGILVAQKALEFCEEAGLDSSVGILLHIIAFARLRTSDVKEVGPAYLRALAHFSRVADPRWEGSCRGAYGAALLEDGRFADAEREYDLARKLAMRLGLVREALWVENNHAQMLILLERESEASVLLRHVLEWQRDARLGIAEAVALTSLAFALAIGGDHSESLRVALEAKSLAELHALDDLQLDAALLVGWARARMGGVQAIKELRKAVALADNGTSQQRMKSRLMLADALIETRPDESRDLWEVGVTLAEQEHFDPYTRLVKYVRHRMQNAAVRIGVGGELIFDPRNGWPSFRLAVAILQRWLLSRAFRDAKGNKSEAARYLDITRQIYNDKYKRWVEGRPTRDRYRAPDNDGPLREDHVEHADDYSD